MTTPKKAASDFERWHRAASEYLLLSTTDDDDVQHHLDVAEDYERRALGAATNVRESMLSLGLLSTLATVRRLHQYQLENRVSETPRTPVRGMSPPGQWY